MCAATGDWVKVLKIRLHRAEQGVWFEGEAVGGTYKEGVVGWGCSKCRSQRLKLAKFLFGRNLRKPVLRSSPKFHEESIKIAGVRAIFCLVNFWCGLARWPNKGGKNPV